MADSQAVLPALLAQAQREVRVQLLDYVPLSFGSNGERPYYGVIDNALRAAEARLSGWRFRPNGSEGFAKAEVTLGGISTAELSSQTMAAKRVPGLYAIGEAVDVTGWLGGYNFQWAWASGVAAGEAI